MKWGWGIVAKFNMNGSVLVGLLARRIIWASGPVPNFRASPGPPAGSGEWELRYAARDTFQIHDSAVRNWEIQTRECKAHGSSNILCLFGP